MKLAATMALIGLVVTTAVGVVVELAVTDEVADCNGGGGVGLLFIVLVVAC